MAFVNHFGSLVRSPCSCQPCQLSCHALGHYGHMAADRFLPDKGMRSARSTEPDNVDLVERLIVVRMNRQKYIGSGFHGDIMKALMNCPGVTKILLREVFFGRIMAGT